MVFNIVSAIATAIAAIAAWKSAQLAERITASSQADARMQIYVAHQQQFDRIIEEMEKEMFVGFFRRIHLYDQLFPTNRDLGKPFTPKAVQDPISAWFAQYEDCEKVIKSEMTPSHEYIEGWMRSCIGLSRSMNFTFRQLNEGDGEILWDGHKTTWFGQKGGKPFNNLGEALYRLATFGLIEQPQAKLAIERNYPVFFAAYARYYEDIAQGRTNHKLS